MKFRCLSLCLLLTLPLLTSRGAQDEPIDWNRAQQLHRKAQTGGKLTPEEQAYYDRARASRGNSQPQVRQASAQPKWTGHLTPLTELGAANYKLEDGGLYGGGRNDPPKAHFEAALKEAAKIRPLDTEGNASADGKIGLLSVGMSNTTQEYLRFKEIADADPLSRRSTISCDIERGCAMKPLQQETTGGRP